MSVPLASFQQFPHPMGWCEKQGSFHSWEAGPTKLSFPPIQTRICQNCGKRQSFKPGEWEDE